MTGQGWSRLQWRNAVTPVQPPDNSSEGSRRLMSLGSLRRAIVTLLGTLQHHDMVHLLNVDIALRTGLAAFFTYPRNQIPAGDRKIENGRAFLAILLAASAYFPAGSDGQQFLYAGNVEPFFGQQFSQALEPLQIVIRIKPLSPSTSRLD